jgi:hypothetical protein
MTIIQAVAAPFRHSRKERLKRNEVVYFLAFDRKWMSIEEANTLIRIAIERGLVKMEGDMVTPLFDPGSVEVPIGFRPHVSVITEDDPVEELVARIAAETGATPGSVIEDMNRLINDSFDGTINPEAAVVIIARNHRVAFSDLVKRLTAHLLQGLNKGPEDEKKKS